MARAATRFPLWFLLLSHTFQIPSCLFFPLVKCPFFKCLVLLPQTYYAVQDTKAYRTETEVESIHATIECEQPQPDLYKSVQPQSVQCKIYLIQN